MNHYERTRPSISTTWFCGYRNFTHEDRVEVLEHPNLPHFFSFFFRGSESFKVIPILWLVLFIIVVEPKKTNGKKKSKREKTKKSKKPKEIEALDIFEKYEGSGFHDNLNQFLDDTLNGNGIDISSTRKVFWPFRDFYAILIFSKKFRGRSLLALDDILKIIYGLSWMLQRKNW